MKAGLESADGTQIEGEKIKEKGAVGLDGQGGSRVFSDYTQWTAAQAETDAIVKKAATKPAAVASRK